MPYEYICLIAQNPSLNIVETVWVERYETKMGFEGYNLHVRSLEYF